MKLFGKSKVTAEELERQAAQELESVVAQARPPTEAERTWVLPVDEVPEVPRRPRRNPVRVRTGLLTPPEEEQAPAGASRPTASAAGTRTTARRPRPASAQTGSRPGAAKGASRSKPASSKPAAKRAAKTGR